MSIISFIKCALSESKTIVSLLTEITSENEILGSDLTANNSKI